MRRSGPQALALPSSVLMAVLWLAIACGTGGSGSSPAAATAAPPTATVAVPATHAPSPPPTAAVPASPESPATPGAATPPQGLLAASGASVSGQLGSYCWSHGDQTDCVDRPDYDDKSLPPLEIETDDQLAFTLDPAVPFSEWSASYWKEGSDAVELGRVDASDPDATASPSPTFTQAAFPAPPSGEWTVSVRVTFAAGGDASYGWNVAVP